VLRHLDAFVTVENAFDRRYRTINERAYINAEEFIGIPQNPRRITVGFELRLQ
jgi:outer membrane receptor protein involved in Fe transport